jgi:hypothetical protein
MCCNFVVVGNLGKDAQPLAPHCTDAERGPALAHRLQSTGHSHVAFAFSPLLMAIPPAAIVARRRPRLRARPVQAAQIEDAYTVGRDSFARLAYGAVGGAVLSPYGVYGVLRS